MKLLIYSYSKLNNILTQQDYFQSDKRKRYGDLQELPENTPSLLLSAIYLGDEQKVYLKFYDSISNKVYFWRDRTNHKPYCYTKIQYKNTAEKIVQIEKKYSLESTKKIDLISDREVDILKIIAPDPLSIGGTENSIREKITSWEADIKYHENYLYDTGLIPGSYYIRKGEEIKWFEYPISNKVQEELKNLLWNKIKEEEDKKGNKEYRQYITNWAQLLNQPIPNLKRVSIDIEVESEEGRMPTPRDHERPVIAVGFVANDGFKKVLVLEPDESHDDRYSFIQEVEICKTEKELLKKTFQIINSYPIIVTYNGDDFDLPYLYARSQDPRIDPVGKEIIPKDEIPIIIKRESFVKRGIQAEHCLKDADLTFRLTSFNDNLLMKLLVVISRISRLSIDDVARFGVNQWIRGMLYYEHRQRQALIPRRDELQAKGSSSTTAIIKEKKYRGGLVVEPALGIHFNVVVVDFASLYPSIIKVHNLSYETVNCPHQSCMNDSAQHISETTHWICKDKSISTEERQLYNVVSQAIKVILNASYGVMGAEIFPLYCLPVADATAAIGRSTIIKTIEKCKQLGIDVIYGDTDSLFLRNPSPTAVNEI